MNLNRNSIFLIFLMALFGCKNDMPVAISQAEIDSAVIPHKKVHFEFIYSKVKLDTCLLYPESNILEFAGYLLDENTDDPLCMGEVRLCRAIKGGKCAPVLEFSDTSDALNEGLCGKCDSVTLTNRNGYFHFRRSVTGYNWIQFSLMGQDPVLLSLKRLTENYH